ncbi:MAG: putative zinc-binding protein [Methanosarcinaceae archaeon]|nr:putative zinc-binding protein [Methanosarcinaceae archaeon]
MAENLKMAENVKCSCGSDNVGIFPCAGASNTGQISNKIAVELSKSGVGTMMCTVGIGGHRPGLIKSAEGCDRIIVIDGCPLNCARETLEHAGIAVDTHIEVTGLGVIKNYDLDIPPAQIKEVMEKVVKII